MRRHITLGALLLLAATGCATTGATLGSGVGDTLVDHPPYYAGGRVVGAADRISHLRVGYQRGAAQAAIFDPAGTAGTPVAELLAEMNRYLDSLGVSAPLGATISRTFPAGTAPDVKFGCRYDASGDCEERDDGAALGRGRVEMQLAVGRPSQSWASDVGAQLTRDSSAAVLVLTLEVGQYLPRQTGLVGKKSVELGTRHTADLPWLTSLETPVSVLQLTGALVDREGKAMRIGAEGLFARRTNLMTSALGGQRLTSDEDVQKVRTLRRDDLPGQPLVWQVAMRELVKGLTGR